MKITQELVDRIIERAEKSKYSLHRTEGTISLEQYKGRSLEELALLLVSAYYSKYDLVSVFLAALETVEEETKHDAAMKAFGGIPVEEKNQ